MQYTCPRCGSAWMEARYDLQAAREHMLDALSSRPFNLWRYREILPIHKIAPGLSMGEGGTPLVRAVNLGMMLGNERIFVKDERQGPTNSFKDRQAALGIAALKEAGITEAVLASTGNVAIAFSAYAARAGIKLWAFLTSLVPPEKMREVALYGTQVVKVTASYDQAKKMAAEFARQRDLYYERGSKSIPSVEGMKTIALEVAEQLTRELGPPEHSAAPWRAPDWYVQAVSGGLGPQGVIKGFRELYEMGLVDKIPAIASIQTAGCAPMVHAWKADQAEATPIASPRTHIATLSTGAPGRTYNLLYLHAKRYGGALASVSDEEAFRAMHILAKMEGLSVEPATAVAFAGLFNLVREGTILPNDVVVVNCTGHTIPIERTVLGEGWARNLVVRRQRAAESGGPEEGLLSALSRLTADRYPRVAIVDDTPDARRLIRRILQAQGDFTIFEAEDGEQAIELARREKPDLMILDLMMPKVDGFGVLDALKQEEETAEIPVIVVTAKELTPAEKRRLQGQVHSLMQKGEFMSDDLADEIRSLVE